MSDWAAKLVKARERDAVSNKLSNRLSNSLSNSTETQPVHAGRRATADASRPQAISAEHPKCDRKAYLRAYMREYMRKKRARLRA